MSERVSRREAVLSALAVTAQGALSDAQAQMLDVEDARYGQLLASFVKEHKFDAFLAALDQQFPTRKLPAVSTMFTQIIDTTVIARTRHGDFKNKRAEFVGSDKFVPAVLERLKGPSGQMLRNHLKRAKNPDMWLKGMEDMLKLMNEFFSRAVSI